MRQDPPHRSVQQFNHLRDAVDPADAPTKGRFYAQYSAGRHPPEREGDSRTGPGLEIKCGNGDSACPKLTVASPLFRKQNCELRGRVKVRTERAIRRRCGSARRRAIGEKTAMTISSVRKHAGPDRLQLTYVPMVGLYPFIFTRRD